MVLVVSQMRLGTRIGPTWSGEKRCSNCVLTKFSPLIRSRFCLVVLRDSSLCTKTCAKPSSPENCAFATVRLHRNLDNRFASPKPHRMQNCASISTPPKRETTRARQHPCTFSLGWPISETPSTHFTLRKIAKGECHAVWISLVHGRAV